MELIILDREFKEVGTLKKFSLDIDLANDKSFSIETAKGNALDFQIGFGWYIPNTEYGGIIDQIKVKTDAANNNTVEYIGRSWRGWLSEFIYYYGGVSFSAGVSFEKAIDKLTTVFKIDNFVEIDTDYKSLTLPKAYNSNLYPNFYDCLIELAELSDLNLRFEFKTKKRGKVRIGFVEKKRVDKAHFTADNSFYFEATKKSTGINHLICMGAGEYPDRTVIHLYADDDGNISQEQTITGIDYRAAIYDYANAESEEDLLNSGIEHFKELLTPSEIVLSVEDLTLNIGDKVKGVEELTGLEIESEIASVIFKLETQAQGETASVEYSIKNEV